MTREQELERELTAWLANGPSTAPPAVVDGALEQVARTGQRHWLPARLATLTELRPAAGVEGTRVLRLVILVLLLAALLAATLLTSLPFTGAPVPEPLDPNAVLHVPGSHAVTGTYQVGGAVVLAMTLSLDDARLGGSARLVERAEHAAGGEMQRASGWLRIENPAGAWQGEVLRARYPGASEVVYGWLRGEGAYDGFSYFIDIHSDADRPEGVVEGFIWPGEPPSVPDPELLP